MWLNFEGVSSPELLGLPLPQTWVPDHCSLDFPTLPLPPSSISDLIFLPFLPGDQLFAQALSSPDPERPVNP
jgi:hypothetical protein